MSLEEKITKCPHCGQESLHEIPDSEIIEGYSYCATEKCDWHDFCDCRLCELAFHDCYDEDNIIEEDGGIDGISRYCSICEKQLN